MDLDIFSLATRGVEMDSSNKEKTKGVEEADQIKVVDNLAMSLVPIQSESKYCVDPTGKQC